MAESSMTSSEHLAIIGKASSPSMSSGNWDSAGGMDQITVVRIDDTHIAEEQSHGGGKVKDSAEDYYEVEYSIPVEEEVCGEEEDDGIYVIEYSNPEEEGESYQFTMSVDRSLPLKKPALKHPAVTENAGAPLPEMSKPSRPVRPRQEMRPKRKLVTEEEKTEEVLSNKCVLEHEENYRDMMEVNSGSGKRLVCLLCPPPGRFFKRGSGLAVHLKQIHQMTEKKTFFCTSCQQFVRSQIELDTHTRRHASQDAVFTCQVCSAETEKAGFRGSRRGLRRHLEKEHPGVIPRCSICDKGFRSLASYLADQFRHVGVSPYYCAKCQIYEMTERGLSVHTKNHEKKKKKTLESENHQQVTAVFASAENSATDDSDF